MRILLGTRNKGKIAEMHRALSGLPFELMTPEEAGIAHDPEEHGETYEENATLKARAYAELSGLPTIADDSGIVVEALRGELGVQTRRWGAGKSATDAEWIAYFLDRMKREANKRAEFVSVVAYADSSQSFVLFKGVCPGIITEDIDGDYLPGLPLRSCFIPDGFDRTLSRMTYEEERAVNHRYKAMQQLKDHLSQALS